MATTLRLSEDLKTRADRYAVEVGVSLAALVSIALRDYLDARSASIAPRLPVEILRAPSEAESAAPVSSTRGDRGRRDKRRK